MKTQAVAASILLPLIALLSASACADIGAIGSPVQASNAPESPAAAETPSAGNNAQEVAAAPAIAAQRKPVLVIRFNQRHVYFERPLKQAVESVERAKPGATYELVSYVPSAGNREQGGRASEEASNNLGSVVGAMQNMGIPASQIHTSTQSSQQGSVQEIDIFVQ